MEFTQKPQLSVFLGHEALPDRRQFDVEIKLGQVEVRREQLDRPPVGVPADRECPRFVSPFDLIEREDVGKFPFTRVREARIWTIGKELDSLTMLNNCGFLHRNLALSPGSAGGWDPRRKEWAGQSRCKRTTSARELEPRTRATAHDSPI